jgi:hypothetical protein
VGFSSTHRPANSLLLEEKGSAAAEGDEVDATKEWLGNEVHATRKDLRITV